MTLKEFLEINGKLFPVQYDNGYSIALTDSVEAKNIWDLWNLSDYKVFSVSNGFIWLHLRNK